MESVEQDGQSRPRRFRIVDKHGLSRFAYNLQIQIEMEGGSLSLGLDEEQLPVRSASSLAGEGAVPQASVAAPSAEELFDDLASMLKKHGDKSITED